MLVAHLQRFRTVLILIRPLQPELFQHSDAKAERRSRRASPLSLNMQLWAGSAVEHQCIQMIMASWQAPVFYSAYSLTSSTMSDLAQHVGGVSVHVGARLVIWEAQPPGCLPPRKGRARLDLYKNIRETQFELCNDCKYQVRLRPAKCSNCHPLQARTPSLLLPWT